jgi:hypothetical protein
LTADHFIVATNASVCLSTACINYAVSGRAIKDCLVVRTDTVI